MKRFAYKAGVISFWGALGYFIFLLVGFYRGLSPLYGVRIDERLIVLSRWFDLLLFPAYLIIFVECYLSLISHYEREFHEEKKKRRKFFVWFWLPAIGTLGIVIMAILSQAELNIGVRNAIIATGIIALVITLVEEKGLGFAAGLGSSLMLGICVGVISGMANAYLILLGGIGGTVIGVAAGVVIVTVFRFLVWLHKKAFTSERISPERKEKEKK